MARRINLNQIQLKIFPFHSGVRNIRTRITSIARSGRFRPPSIVLYGAPRRHQPPRSTRAWSTSQQCCPRSLRRPPQCKRRAGKIRPITRHTRPQAFHTGAFRFGRCSTVGKCPRVLRQPFERCIIIPATECQGGSWFRPQCARRESRGATRRQPRTCRLQRFDLQRLRTRKLARHQTKIIPAVPAPENSPRASRTPSALHR